MQIDEVRELLGDLPREMPAFLTDATIRRFLRARSWSSVQAAKALKEAAQWRRLYQPEKICWEDITDRENEAKRAYIADYLDKKGRQVYLTRPTIKSKTSDKEIIKFLVYNLENLSLNLEDAQEENVVWISDCRGWAISSTPVSLTRESLRIIQKYYPGIITAGILTNPPKVFESFWKIVKLFIEPEFREKVIFVYDNNPESQRTLADMFDLDKLESVFGGRNTTGFDVSKYAERMKRQDHIRGARTHANGSMSSSLS
ncbi:hypothetical protein ACP4OV_015974 [Aristida adscensionis]